MATRGVVIFFVACLLCNQSAPAKQGLVEGGVESYD